MNINSIGVTGFGNYSSRFVLNPLLRAVAMALLPFLFSACETARTAHTSWNDPFDAAMYGGSYVGVTPAELVQAKDDCWRQANKGWGKLLGDLEIPNHLSGDTWSFWTVGRTSKSVVHSRIVFYFPNGKGAWTKGMIFEAVYDLQKHAVVAEGSFARG